MEGSALEEKSSFKMLGLPFYFKLDSDACIISIAKTPSKKIGALSCPMKFFYLLFFSINLPIGFYKKYCCHAWAGAPIYYMDILDRL